MSDLRDQLARLTPEQRALLELRLAKRRSRDGRETKGGARGAIPRRVDEDGHPLSPAQERLWFLDRLEPDSPLYNVPLAVRWQRRLEPRLLAESVAAVVARHEVLRARFREEGGRPVQQVDPPFRPALPVVDLAGLGVGLDGGQETGLNGGDESPASRLAAAFARRPFDLARGPLLALALLRLGPREHHLLLCLHHVVADGWSMEVLLRELLEGYQARVEGRRPELPDLPVQYADFAAWQRRRLADGLLAEQLHEWRRRLAGASPVLELPTDRPRGAAPSFRGGRRPLALPRPAVPRSAEGETSTFAFILAALQTLLGRWSGQDDLLVGVPVANRSRPELEHLVGFFVNTLVLRGRLVGDPPFRRLLAATREEVLSAWSLQDLPFERLVEELPASRRPDRHPFFQIMLAFHGAPPALFRQAGLELLPVHTGTAKFDLTFEVVEGDAGLTGSVEYNVDLFDATTVERLLAGLGRLLTGAAAEPDRHLSELPLLGPAEHQQVIREWNGGNGGRPAAAVAGTLHDRFQSWAARRPAAVALVFGEERWSYGGLAGRVRRLARRLAERGVGPEEPVALALPRSPELVVSVLAMLEAGGCYVPVDPEVPAERLALVLADCGARLLLAREPWAAAVPPGVELLDPLEEERAGGEGQETDDAATLPAEALAYVIYTSGSTGRPKGVGVSHRNVLRLLEETAPRFAFGPDDVWTLFHSYAFDFSVWELWGALGFGGRLVGVPYWISREPEAFWTLLLRERVTVLNQTPSAFTALVRAIFGPASRAPGGMPPAGSAVPGGGRPSAYDPLSATRDAAPPDGSGGPGASAVAGSDPTDLLGASLRAARELAPFGRSDKRGPSSLRSPSQASSDASDRSCATAPGPPAPSPAPFCATESSPAGRDQSDGVPPARSVAPSENAEEGPASAGQVASIEGAAPSPGGAARPDPLSAPPGGGGPFAQGEPGTPRSAPPGGGSPCAQGEPGALRSAPPGGGSPSAQLSLRWVIFGGEALEVAPVRRWVERFGDERPGLVNMYGITETTVHVTWRRLSRVDLEAGWGGRSPLGRAIPDLALHLLDRRGRPVPAGVVGEISVGGPGVARGYVGHPGWTAARFVPGPFSETPGERLYASGDLGRFRPDGELEYIGRADHQVKVRGFRIEPGEVEAALLEHPSVAEAVVLARLREPGAAGGGSDRILVAYLVPRGEAGLDEAALRAALRARLPEPLIPAVLVPLGRLPLTPNGKVDRRALAALALPEAPAGGDAPELPRSPAEEIVAGVWADLLGRTRVGVHDDFFALGGHSLLAVQVLARLRETFGVSLPVRDFFEQPTVAGLAARLQSLLKGPAPLTLDTPPLERLPRDRPLPLSPAQERLWFLDRLAPSATAYNIPALLRLTGHLDLAALHRGLTALSRRHEILRTTYAAAPGGPVQVIHSRLAPAFGLVDLQALPAAARRELARRLAAGEARRPFQLTRGPLLRAVLLRLGPRERATVGEQAARPEEGVAAERGPAEHGPAEHQGLLTLHHIAADGASLEILVRELGEHYRTFLAGRPPELPPLPVQYADFALWQRRRLAGGELERLLTFWRRRLAGAPGSLELPTDRPRPPVRSSRAGVRRRLLPGGVAEAVEGLARRTGVTPFMLLLAALDGLLLRLTGESDLTVGSPVAGRLRPELAPLVGCFVNLLPLRVDLAGDPPFRELLARVRETALAAYAHQELPFEKLVGALSPQRDTSRPPLFQVVFVYQRPPAESLELPGLAVELLPPVSGGAKVDLTWSAEPAAGGLALAVEYAQDLFDAATVERWLAGFGRLLAGAVAEPDRRLSELPLLSPAERQQVVREWNGGRPAAPVAGTLHGRFERWAARRPEGVALVFGSQRWGSEQWTYGALARRVRRLAGRLAGHGVGLETPVVLALPRSVEQVVALLAVLTAGGCYVPVDPSVPAERLARMVEDSGARWLLAGPMLPAQSRPIVPSLGGGAVESLDLAQEEAAGGKEAQPRAVPVETLAYVIYTSGSTGRPKGVGVPHRHVLRLLDQTEAWFRFGPDEVWALFHSYAFDFSVWELWGALAHGGRLVGVPYWVSREPGAFWELVLRERVTVLNQTPSAFGALLRAALHPLAGSPTDPSDGRPPAGSGGPGTSAVAGSDPTGLLGASLRAARELAPFGRSDRRGPSSLRSPSQASSDASDRSYAPAPGPPPPPPTPFFRTELALDGGGREDVVPPVGSTVPSEGGQEGPPSPAPAAVSEGGQEGPREGSGGRLAPGGQETAPCTAVWSPSPFPARSTTGAAARVESHQAAPSPGGAARPDPFSAPPGGGPAPGSSAPLGGGPASGPSGPPGVGTAPAQGRPGTLRWVIFGGEALDLARVRPWMEHFGDRRPALVNMYGITETTVHVTGRRLGRRDVASGGRSPLGAAIPDLSLHLLDPRGRPVPMGVVGEIFVGGAGVARGYIGWPALTAERFLPDPWGETPGGRLYRSGDLGRWRPDCDLEHAGRADHQVKVRGFRIEPGEVEAALLEHPAVAEAVVAARSPVPPAGGREGLTLVAYLVLRGGTEVVVPALREHLRSRLPEHLVPATFVLLDRLPLTPNGKVDRVALPPPGEDRPGLADPPPSLPPPPASPLEELLAGIWCQVLGRSRVDREASFFDQGGDSLLAAEVHRRLQEELGREIPLVELFRHPTVRTLASSLEPGEPPGAAKPAGTGVRPASRSASRRRRRPPEDRAVAVIGMAGRFPGARDLAELWANLRQGVESITFFSDRELLEAGVDPARLADPAYVKARGVMAEVELFDAPFFGLSPREAEILDPQHRLFLEQAWAALEDAGHDPRGTGGRVGVFAGAGASAYGLRLASDPRLAREVGGYQALLGGDKDFLTTRVSYKLDLSGPSVDVQTACSTSLVAVHLAIQSLLAGECDLALAGGVSVLLPRVAGYTYQPEMILSPDGHCRPFDTGARGTVPGEGVGVVVLKPLADALADGDPVRAVIRGSAMNNDGALKAGYTAPGVRGQAEVIAQAWETAGVPPASAGYVETHGTGTALGDPIEVAALRQVFEGELPPASCLLGSVKSNLGHTDAAAGVAGLIKTVLALEHREIPPSLHVQVSNPEIDFGPFAVARERVPWQPRPGDGGRPVRRAGVSSFGIGGTNVHVVVEEAPEKAPAAPPVEATVGPRLLVLSARTEAALEAATGRLAEHLGRHPELPLGDVAWTLAAGRHPFVQRRVAVAGEPLEAARILAGEIPAALHSGTAGEAPPAAFLFPGQGSRLVGLGRELARRPGPFRRELERCAELLAPHLEVDLLRLLDPEPEEAGEAEACLARTLYAQPALFALEVALGRLWLELGVEPRGMLGHSLGEYAAACLAGVFPLDRAVPLVAARARLLEGLAPGAMLAVALGEEEVAPLLGAELALAAVNAPGRTVLSGSEEAVEELARRLAADGVATRRLATGRAFHSPRLEPVLAAFAHEVRRAGPRPPERPFLSNLTGTWIRPEEAADPDYWVAHLRGAVRFQAGLEALTAGVEPGVLVEVGPGGVLVPLARRQARGWTVAAGLEPEGEERSFLQAVGRVWAAGVEVDWERLHPEPRRRLSLPTYPFERRRYWLEPRSDAGAAGAAHAPGKLPEVGDWLYLPFWKPAPPQPSLAAVAPDEAATSILLVGDGDDLTGDLAGELAAVLESAGRRVERAGDGEEATALLVARAETGELPERVVHLAAVAALPPEDDPLHRFQAAQKRLLYPLLALARELVHHAAGRRLELTVVGCGLVEAGGGAVEPAKAPLLAFTRVLPQEAGNLAARAVDLDPDELTAGGPRRRRLVAALAAELLSPPEEPVVALGRGGRRVERFERISVRAPATNPPALRPGGAYLITGGLGRIGLTLAEYLARTVQARLILTGRSPFPRREDWPAWLDEHGPDHPVSRKVARLLACEHLGAEVMVERADVTDPEAMARVLARARERFGPLRGLFHLAGSGGEGAFRPLSETDPQLCRRHFRPKVEGLLVLDRLLARAEETGEEGPDFCLLFSSLSTLLGGLGFTAYAAANAFLDAFARRRAATSPWPWLSVDWDGWLPAAAEEAAGAATGRPRLGSLELAIHPDEGQAAVGRLLALLGEPRVVVSTGHLEERLARWVAPAGAAAGESRAEPASRHPRPELTTSYAEPAGEVEAAVAACWRELFAVDRVGREDDFFELGGDSLLATQLMARLRRELAVDLSLPALLEAPTVAGLAAAVEAARGGGEETALEEILAEIEGLSTAGGGSGSR